MVSRRLTLEEKRKIIATQLNVMEETNEKAFDFNKLFASFPLNLVELQLFFICSAAFQTLRLNIVTSHISQN